MEEKRPGRLGGSKVSQIANIFQGMAPGKEENVLIVGGTRTPESPKLPRKDADTYRDLAKEPVTVTVVRTESHVARFNNARAMFEKLGEENQKVNLRSSSKASINHDRRSRSSSANSSDGTSQTSPSQNKQASSRSPSPSHYSSANKSMLNGHDLVNENCVNNKINNKQNAEKQNCFFKDNKVKENERIVIDTAKSYMDCSRKVPEKPLKPEKPEKPERKINNLIEKQRNWPSHFSNRRTSNKASTEPKISPLEPKTELLSVNEEVKEQKTPSPVSPKYNVPYLASPTSSCSMGSPQEEKQEREIPEKSGDYNGLHTHIPGNQKSICSRPDTWK